jgi:hypothetical protein
VGSQSFARLVTIRDNSRDSNEIRPAESGPDLVAGTGFEPV